MIYLSIKQISELIEEIHNENGKLAAAIPYCETRKEAEDLENEIIENQLKIEDLEEEITKFTAPKFGLLIVWSDVEPEIFGPFTTEEERNDFAKQKAFESSLDHSFFPMEWTGETQIATYSSNFFKGL